MTKLIILSGWANPKGSLKTLSKELASVFDVLTVSVHDLPSFALQYQDPSLRAHGDRKNAKALSGYARGLTGLIERIDGPCLLMGWSAGGLIALETALRRQDRIKGLILISTTARFCADADYRFGRSVQTVRVMARGLRKDAARVLTGFFEAAAVPFTEDSGSIKDKVDSALGLGIDSLCQGLEYLQHADMRDALGRITTPSLVLHGKEDMIIPWRAGQMAAEKMRNSRWVLLDGIGHDLPVRSAEYITEQVQAFRKNLLTCLT
ncbi:Pimeloyl-[acyl-carrier protein] methyl ester esterase [bacterium BMS3Abin10]|nr:Pimeloyl-[acyl-carrier protein] methyl ester esterase [bacterium BMS3Abin10]GBE40084.1 Pimeloyl-[acyl-carrier protein] methyl ester esterase [bacterium BMS3Bbin08]HDH51001.1 alpha/beta fold hydrolase [Nitrospirota bacterium]HDK17429.1 alpha/beta fold hydrolase [Nitrospirota bacterium]